WEVGHYGDAAFYCGTVADCVEPSLEVRAALQLFGFAARSYYPGIGGHVRYRVIACQVRAFGEAVFDYVEKAARFVGVAIDYLVPVRCRPVVESDHAFIL